MRRKRWNIFASILADVLTDHGSELAYLNKEVGIHGEQVRRLRASLNHPPTCTVLNPDELEAVITTFSLNDSEKCRLYAAVIAAGVQEKLVKRMKNDANNALLAIEQVFPILFQALWKHRNDTGGLAKFRGEE